MHYLEAILKVLAVGLILGAGAVPRCSRSDWSPSPKGAGGADADGTTTAPNPALKAVGLLLFTLPPPSS